MFGSVDCFLNWNSISVADYNCPQAWCSVPPFGARSLTSTGADAPSCWPACSSLTGASFLPSPPHSGGSCCSGPSWGLPSAASLSRELISFEMYVALLCSFYVGRLLLSVCIPCCSWTLYKKKMLAILYVAR